MSNKWDEIMYRKYSSKKLVGLLDNRMNLAAVARSAGISSTALNKLKEGSIPSANTLVALADSFNKPLDYFFEPIILHSEEKVASNG